MKCYIYKIINNVTNEKYVGQTTNFSRRIENHLSALRNNKHVNPKLQSSWNKYGESNFSIEKQIYDLTKEELNQKEIEEIEKENSFYNGFNLTAGGDGGNTRGSLTFEQYCFLYFGNIKYDGMTVRSGNYYNVDSSTVSSIKRGTSYLWFKERADNLSLNEKEQYIKKFETELNIFNNPPIKQRNKLSQEQIILFLSIISVYGRGAEAAITRFLNISKGLKNHIVKGEYREEATAFMQLTDEEIEQIATTNFNKNNLQQYCTQKIKKNTKVIRPIFEWYAH